MAKAMICDVCSSSIGKNDDGSFKFKSLNHEVYQELCEVCYGKTTAAIDKIKNPEPIAEPEPVAE